MRLCVSFCLEYLRPKQAVIALELLASAFTVPCFEVVAEVSVLEKILVERMGL